MCVFDGLFWGQRALACVLLLVAVVAHCTKLLRSGCSFASFVSISISDSVSGFSCNLMVRLKSLKYFPSAPPFVPLGSLAARRTELVQNYV